MKTLALFLTLIAFDAPSLVTSGGQVDAGKGRLEELLRVIEGGDEDAGLAAATTIVAMGKLAQPAIPRMIRGLKSFSRENITRRDFERLLVTLGPIVIPALRDALSDPDIGTRKIACELTGEMGPAAKDVIPDLIRLMSEPGYNISHDASFALGEVGGPAVPYLLDLLRSDDSDLRQRVAEMSVRRVPIQAELESQLLQLIQDPSEKPTAQHAAINALSAIKRQNPRKVISIVVERLGESRGNVGSAAAHTLGRIGPLAAPEVMATFESDNAVARSWQPTRFCTCSHL